MIQIENTTSLRARYSETGQRGGFYNTFLTRGRERFRFFARGERASPKRPGAVGRDHRNISLKNFTSYGLKLSESTPV